MNVSGLMESVWQTLDIFKDGPTHLLNSKVSHGPHNFPQIGRVHKYYPEDNTADVWVAGAGDGPPVRLPLEVHYQGLVPGTGEAYAVFDKQLVKIRVGPDGAWSTATIIGTIATPKDQYSPNHPTWAQARDRAARLTIDTGKDGEGNVNIVDTDSNIYDIKTGTEHKEAMGSASSVQSGPYVSYTEMKTKEMGNKMDTLAEGIKI